MNPTDWLTLALVAVTGWYAWITKKILAANEAMATATQEQQRAMMRPYVQVAVDVRIGTTLIYLQVENVGRTAAQDLTLSLNKDFYQLGNLGDQNNLKLTSAFSKSISSFAPNAKLRFLLGPGYSIFGGNADHCPREFQITATYFTGAERVTEISNVDLNPYLHTEAPTDPIVEELAKLREKIGELERIRKALEAN